MDNLISLTEDELLILIGKDLFSDELAAFPFNPNELLIRVKKWIEFQKPKLQERVCKDSYFKDTIKDDKLEKSVLVMHVTELIADLHYSEFTVAAIAIYIVNFAYKNLCF